MLRDKLLITDMALLPMSTIVIVLALQGCGAYRACGGVNSEDGLVAGATLIRPGGTPTAAAFKNDSGLYTLAIVDETEDGTLRTSSFMLDTEEWRTDETWSAEGFWATAVYTDGTDVALAGMRGLDAGSIDLVVHPRLGASNDALKSCSVKNSLVGASTWTGAVSVAPFGKRRWAVGTSDGRIIVFSLHDCSSLALAVDGLRVSDNPVVLFVKSDELHFATAAGRWGIVVPTGGGGAAIRQSDSDDATLTAFEEAAATFNITWEGPQRRGAMDAMTGCGVKWTQRELTFWNQSTESAEVIALPPSVEGSLILATRAGCERHVVVSTDSETWYYGDSQWTLVAKAGD